MNIVLQLLLLSTCLISLWLFIYALYNKFKIQQQKQQHNIPKGKIIYSDLETSAHPLYSKRLRLAGKPDYIMLHNNQYIPVEVKTCAYQQPQKNHILQLAAYCHLVEANYNTFVLHGFLIYTHTTFQIPFNPQLRYELETTIARMRNQLRKSCITRNHNDPQKCKACSLKPYCTVQIQ